MKVLRGVVETFKTISDFFAMKKAHWSIVLVGSGVNGHSRCVPFNRTIFIVSILIIMFGLIGLGRCVYFFSSCGIAKLGLYYNNKENYQLKSKVQFL